MKPRVLLTLILLGCGLGLLSLFLITNRVQPKNFDEFALGKGTASYFASEEGVPIHLSKINKLEVESLLAGWEKRGKKKVCLILGNSQTHGINQYKEGEKSYNHLLFDEFRGLSLIHI